MRCLLEGDERYRNLLRQCVAKHFEPGQYIGNGTDGVSFVLGIYPNGDVALNAEILRTLYTGSTIIWKAARDFPYCL